jgi:hypothetical protein
MKIFRKLSPATGWLMRTGVLLFALMYYFDVLRIMNLQSVMFYVSAAYLALSVLLFVLGFSGKTELTQWVALGLILLTGYQAFVFGRAGIDYNFAVFVLLGAILLVFLTKPEEVTTVKITGYE